MSQSALGLLKLALDYDIYEKHKSLFLDSFFAKPIDKVWVAIKEAHIKYQRTLSCEEIEQLVFAKNGVLTTAVKDNISEILQRVSELEPISSDVAIEVLRHAHTRECGRAIIEESYGLIEDRPCDLSKIKELAEQISLGSLPETKTLEITTDVQELFEEIDNQPGWHFNIQGLHDKIPVIHGGEFAVIFARPELAKTACWISLTCGPGGFLEQGANVHVLCNEEFAKRNMARAISCATGLTAEEIRRDIKSAAAEWRKICSNIHMLDTLDWTMTDIDEYCKQHKPDILISDQLDKVKTSGPKDQANHERLGDVYVQFREILKRHNALGIGICQASNDAQGKLEVDFSMMEGSKTRKAAELDLAIGIGAHTIIEKLGGDENVNFRMLTISKNKCSGFHGCVPVKIDPMRSRFVDFKQ